MKKITLVHTALLHSSMSPGTTHKASKSSQRVSHFKKWRTSFRPTFLNVLWYLFLAFGAGVVVTRIVGLILSWTQH